MKTLYTKAYVGSCMLRLCNATVVALVTKVTNVSAFAVVTFVTDFYLQF